MTLAIHARLMTPREPGLAAERAAMMHYAMPGGDAREKTYYAGGVPSSILPSFLLPASFLPFTADSTTPNHPPISASTHSIHTI
ncbi:hypothetical protein IAS59_002795 [Cryptococcus gattii]